MGLVAGKRQKQRNGVLKKRTTLLQGMSDDSEEAAETTVSDEEVEPDEDEGGEAIEEGSTDSGLGEDAFIKLAYTARSVDSEQLVDTTDPEVAEEAGVDIEEQTFEPRTVAIGAGHVFPSVETAIADQTVGETGTVEVPAGEAFGEYDPENVRTVSADLIDEDDRYPGAQVEIDGEHGYIETIIGGRARVDFNHPLAGEAIEYEYEILEEITDRIEQAAGLLSSIVDADLEMWISTDEEEVEIEPEEEDDEEPTTEMQEFETLYIESVPQLAMNQQWLFRKTQIAQEIIDRIGVDRVIVQETIEGMDFDLGGMGDIEAALDDVDVDADEIADELADEEDIEE